MNNARLGAYYKARTKKWFLELGWQVADLEVVRWIHRPGKPALPVKRDQFGSDLLLVSRRRIVFVQVKGGRHAAGAGQFLEAQRAFADYEFPPFAERWIVAWAPRSRFPRIVKCQQQEPDVEKEITPQTRDAQGQEETAAAGTFREGWRAVGQQLAAAPGRAARSRASAERAPRSDL